MSVADLSRKGSAGEGSPTRPEGITCPHFDAPPGEKRCRHYLKGGACARPDEFMCVEWLKANGHPVPPQPASPSADLASEAKAPTKPVTDLFGNPAPELVQQRERPRTENSGPAPANAPTPAADPGERPPLRGLTTEDIESFKALGVEVCIRSEAFGDVWLVPDYTGRDRREITPEHAATICRVLDAFPGSQVVSFDKNPKPEKEIEA